MGNRPMDRMPEFGSGDMGSSPIFPSKKKNTHNERTKNQNKAAVKYGTNVGRDNDLPCIDKALVGVAFWLHSRFITTKCKV